MHGGKSFQPRRPQRSQPRGSCEVSALRVVGVSAAYARYVEGRATGTNHFVIKSGRHAHNPSLVSRAEGETSTVIPLGNITRIKSPSSYGSLLPE